MYLIFTIFVTFYALMQTQYVFAASAPHNFKGLVGIFSDLIQSLILLVFALTFIVFMWGIIKGWVIKGGEGEGVEDGKKVLFAGIVALVVMSSVWGIVYILQTSIFGG